MSRLASFRGPSTPTSSPVQPKQHNSPASPSRLAESTFHRKTRTLLQELRSITETWDDLVLIDGLKAARNLVDARTDLELTFCNFLSKTSRTDHSLELAMYCLWSRMGSLVPRLSGQNWRTWKIVLLSWIRLQPS